MQKRKNILHICSWYPNRINPLDGNFIQKQIECVPEEYHNIVLAVYEDPGLRGKKNETIEEESKNIHSIIIYHPYYKNKILSLVVRMYYYYKGFRQIRRSHGKLFLIHAHVFLFAGIVSAIIHGLTRIPYVVTEHSTIYHQKNLKGWRLALTKWAAKHSKKILPVSYDLQSRMEILGIVGNYNTVHNVVNSDYFYPDLKSRPSPIKILHVSTFNDEVKNITGILRVIKKISESRNDFVLQLVGEKDHGVVKEYIDDINLHSDFIEILGPFSEEEVAAYFREASFFVLFSNFETFSVVLAEAWSCGIPAVYSKCGGLTNWTEPELGIQIPKKDDAELEKALIYMLDNHQNFDKIRLHEKAQCQFGKKMIKKELGNLYFDILSEKI